MKGCDFIIEFDVRARIEEFLEAKNWSRNRLATESDVPQSTIESMFIKHNQPSIHTLFKICDGLGITITQFFMSEDDNSCILNDEQLFILNTWNSLDTEYKDIMLALSQSLLEQQKKYKH